MKGFNSKRFLTSISILFILFVAYIYYSSHIDLISDDLLKSSEITFIYNDEKLTIHNADIEIPDFSENDFSELDLKPFFKRQKQVINASKELIHEKKYGDSEIIESEKFRDRPNSNKALSHYYKLEVEWDKSKIFEIKIFTDDHNIIKLVELHRFLSPFEKSKEILYYDIELGGIYHQLIEFTTKSGYSTTCTETDSYSNIIYKDEVLKNSNLRTLNNRNIIHSAYGIKELSNRIVSEIIKKEIQ